MKTSTKFLVITLVFGTIAFFLSRVIWPDVVDMGMPRPSEAQTPLFVFLSLWESAAFGVGIAFSILGWKYIKALMPQNKKAAMACFIAIIWTLISWWPHDNMHRVNPPNDLNGLLSIEFIFHFTLILASFILAHYFWKMIIQPRNSEFM